MFTTMPMKRFLSLFCLVGFGLLLAACAQLQGLTRQTTVATDVAVQSPDAETPRPAERPQRAAAQALGRSGQTADMLDRTSPEERAAALAPAAGRTQFLGDTLASLGGVSEPGLWLRTGLVRETTQGRVELQRGTGSLRVELRPSGAAAGAGSQLSLAAFRSLDVPLSELVALRVYAE